MSTPFITNDSETPLSEGETVVSESQNLTEEKLDSIDQKLTRRRSYGKAAVAPAPPARGGTSDGPSKEHSEQGRVKADVYLQYIEAASKTGFVFFAVATVLQQVASVAGNNTLRAWGEHNLATGDNDGAFVYLLGYGLFSLASTLLGTAAALLIWVLCGVRSARRLHDLVRWICGCSVEKRANCCRADVASGHACAIELL